ncbi:N-acetylgalactosaminyltransferase 7 [Platysternon megacephalum]|uniref:N-acetylgalactosaminyltransferase 7 n=1 Tax=Platysternon megacephalum TaxID=55544 RepID=A0A4D9DWX0_9SAUR|nr:N-acetylgalactosaminyltransferase 7 [Platysternon megacephalum]
MRLKLGFLLRAVLLAGSFLGLLLLWSSLAPRAEEPSPQGRMRGDGEGVSPGPPSPLHGRRLLPAGAPLRRAVAVPRLRPVAFEGPTGELRPRAEAAAAGLGSRAPHSAPTPGHYAQLSPLQSTGGAGFAMAATPGIEPAGRPASAGLPCPCGAG